MLFWGFRGVLISHHAPLGGVTASVHWAWRPPSDRTAGFGLRAEPWRLAWRTWRCRCEGEPLHNPRDTHTHSYKQSIITKVNTSLVLITFILTILQRIITNCWTENAMKDTDGGFQRVFSRHSRPFQGWGWINSFWSFSESLRKVYEVNFPRLQCSKIYIY